jgi:lantibiotic modifying enzyme
MYRITGNPAYRRSASKIADLLIRDHLADESGASWGSTPELMVGDVGAGLFLLYASRELAHPGAEQLARAIGDSVLARATPSGGGLMWSTRQVYGSDYPNFSHGSAGVGYFLVTLYQHTGDEHYLAGALDVGRYLVGIANDTGLVAHHLPDDDGLVYYGWCHGPPGTNLLFGKLSRENPAPGWSNFVERSNRAVMAADILSRKPAGFWQNHGRCCGSAGVAGYFLEQHIATKNPEYLEFARAATRDIIAHATVEGDTLRWTHAEHRTSPQFTQTLTGYMQGAAGTGMHFLRMHAFVNEKPVSIRLLDEESPLMGPRSLSRGPGPPRPPNASASATRHTRSPSTSGGRRVP